MQKIVPGEEEDTKVYFTGEMIFPWMFDDYAELAEIKDLAEQVAGYGGWGELYNIERLRRNRVPVYSAIYMEDMYVPSLTSSSPYHSGILWTVLMVMENLNRYVSYKHAMETARTLGNHKYTISNVHFHDAVRKKTEEVLGGLFKLQEGIVE